MLTRPVAAAVILNNQRNLNSQTSRENSHLSTTSSNGSDLFKVVFDITESENSYFSNSGFPQKGMLLKIPPK